MVVRVPWQSTLSDHSCSDGRAQGGSQRVTCLHQALETICIYHITNPGTPCSIFQTIAKACKRVCYNEDRVGWMKRYDNVCDQTAGRRKKCNSPLAELHVDRVTEDSSDAVARERRKEDQRNDSVC